MVGHYFAYIFIGSGRLIEIFLMANGMDNIQLLEAADFALQIELPLCLFSAKFSAGPV